MSAAPAFVGSATDQRLVSRRAASEIMFISESKTKQSTDQGSGFALFVGRLCYLSAG
jgi:hypothetical protein